jgi:hypothetical protein
LVTERRLTLGADPPWPSRLICVGKLWPIRHHFKVRNAENTDP